MCNEYVAFSSESALNTVYPSSSPAHTSIGVHLQYKPDAQAIRKRAPYSLLGEALGSGRFSLKPREASRFGYSNMPLCHG